MLLNRALFDKTLAASPQLYGEQGKDHEKNQMAEEINFQKSLPTFIVSGSISLSGLS